MVNVFIIWSGPLSHKIAKALHQWLPVVLQSTQVFISSDDLKKGGRWNTELCIELSKESFGILCLTPDNLTAPWILFEAGALSKSVGDAYVAPFLVGVRPSELPGPLTQFNAVNAEKDDFKRLLRDINSRDTSPIPGERIEKSIDGLWPQIEGDLKIELPPKKANVDVDSSKKSIEWAALDKILQEILVLNRNQMNFLTDPSVLLPRDYIGDVISRHYMPDRDHKVWEDLFGGSDELSRVDLEITLPDEVSAAIGDVTRATRYLRLRSGKFGRSDDQLPLFNKRVRANSRFRTGAKPDSDAPDGEGSPDSQKNE